MFPNLILITFARFCTRVLKWNFSSCKMPDWTLMDIWDIKRMLLLFGELVSFVGTNPINVSGGSDSKLPLSFVTRPNVYREEVGDSVLLLCKVNNLGKITILPACLITGDYTTLYCSFPFVKKSRTWQSMFWSSIRFPSHLLKSHYWSYYDKMIHLESQSVHYLGSLKQFQTVGGK